MVVKRLMLTKRAADQAKPSLSPKARFPSIV